MSSPRNAGILSVTYYAGGLLVPAPVCGLVGIQIDKAPDGQILNGLDKAVFIIWMVAKPLTKNVAVIVIAHQQPQRNFQLVEVLLEVIKSLRLAPMCQITRNDTTRGIRMILVDIGDTALKRCCRIAAVQRFACGNKVGVGEMNDLHSSGHIF